MQERLQKIIARAGIASRRHAEQLIVSGQVRVNGHVITELGSKADPAADRIEAAGKVITAEERRVHILLNKPPEVVATMADPEGRKTPRRRLRSVLRPSGSAMVATTSGGLLSKICTRRSSAVITLPAASMRSAAGSALLPSSVITWPFTRTWPLTMSCSA